DGRCCFSFLSLVRDTSAAQARRVLPWAPARPRKGIKGVVVSRGRPAGALQRLGRERSRNRRNLARRGRGPSALLVSRAAGSALAPPPDRVAGRALNRWCCSIRLCWLRPHSSSRGGRAQRPVGGGSERGAQRARS